MSDFVVVCDTREQKPYEFSDDIEITRNALETGDYTIKGYETVFAVERKSLPDFLKSITWERERFKREIMRAESLLGFVVIIEASLKDILEWNYDRDVHPNSVMGTVNVWEREYNVEFVWAGNRDRAEAETLNCLERWYESYNKFYS